MVMSEAARNKKAAYMRDYRQKNRAHINEVAREWRRRNPDKVNAAINRYWENQAEREATPDEQKQN